MRLLSFRPLTSWCVSPFLLPPWCVSTSDGALYGLVEGSPVALFEFAEGQEPAERAGGYGSLDLELGQRVARVAAQMHRALWGLDLPQRNISADPWRQVGAFLASDDVSLPIFRRFPQALQACYEAIAPTYLDGSGVPVGLVHGDLHPLNLRVDAAGDIVAVLDFDDSAHTLLIYELCNVIANFARDDERRLIPAVAESLVAAYDSVRPLTVRERELLPAALQVAAGAEAVRVIQTWLRYGHPVSDAEDSYSARLFFDLTDV